MKKILVIDDILDNLISIGAVIKLNMPDCKVLTAQSGEEGITKAIKEQPDLILLDIIMPKMDGFETCRRIKENTHLKHIPIIMITATKTDTASRVKALDLGADAFISKPIDHAEITAQIRVMLRIKAAEDQLRKENISLEKTIDKKTAELEASEEKYRLYFDHAPVGYQSLDQTACFLDVNQTWLDILGYKKEEVIGKCLGDFLHPKNQKLFRESFKANIQKKEVLRDIVFLLRHKDGHYITAEYTAKFATDKSGRFSRTHCIFQDISERMAIEEENKRHNKIEMALYEISKFSNANLNLHDFLEKVHTQIGGILEAKNFFISLYDKINNTYTFPYFIDETEKSKPLGNVHLSSSLTDLVRREGKGHFITREIEEHLIKDKHMQVFGQPSAIWLGAPLFNAFNKEVIGVISVQDYSNEDAYSTSDLEILEIFAYNIGSFIERIQNHEALKIAKEKAEESDRLKSAFLANMSHEIRTPMNGILGFTELLKEPDISSEELDQYIDIIARSGKRLLNIINDLMDISKIEAGQVELFLSNTNINKQLDYLHSFFLPEMRKKGLDFIKFLPPLNKTLFLYTDKEKLNAILSNLLKNALKYTKQGSIEFGYEIQKDSIKFFVKDTGIGISEDRREAIFERFVQADIEDSKALEGAGLGLAISKAYSEILNGKLWLKPNEHGGSSFFLEIPINDNFTEDINTRTKLEQRKPKSLKNTSILVAEDEESSVLLVKEILKGECEKIVHATNGRDAIDKLKNNPEIAIILMDIKMPEMNGYEASRQIRTFNNDVVIIAQTAYAMTGDREKALQAGCNEYITKPLIKNELLKIIYNFIES